MEKKERLTKKSKTVASVARELNVPRHRVEYYVNKRGISIDEAYDLLIQQKEDPCTQDKCDYGTNSTITELRKEKLIQDIRHKKAQAQREELKAQQAMRTLIPMEQVDDFLKVVASITRTSIEGLTGSLPGKVEGLNAIKARSVISKECDNIMQAIKAAIEQHYKVDLSDKDE